MSTVKRIIAENANIANKLEVNIVKGNSYENLPISSPLVHGIVKIDGSTIKINPNGQLYSVNSNSGSGNTSQEVLNHIADSIIHLNQSQITAINSIASHTADSNVHLSALDILNLSNLSSHLSNNEIHLTGDNLTKLQQAHNHSNDTLQHLSTSDRNNINGINEHYLNSIIHLSTLDREKVDETISHIANNQIHLSLEDRTLINQAIASGENVISHIINNNIHFTSTEKAELIDKLNLVVEVKANADMAYSLAKNVSMNKLDRVNHEYNKVLITDNEGNVVYHPTIAASSLGTGSGEGVVTTGGSKITTSQTAPLNPQVGDVWISW